MSGSCYPSSLPSLIRNHVPEWVFCPADRIIEVVALWIVGGFLDLIEVVVGFVLTYWNIVRTEFGHAGGDVWAAGVDVGLAIEGAVFSVNSALLDIAASAGLAGPVAAAAVFFLFLAGTVAALRGLIAFLRAVRIWGV